MSPRAPKFVVGGPCSRLVLLLIDHSQARVLDCIWHPLLFPSLPLSSRHNFRNFRNESLPLHRDLLVANKDQSSNTRVGGQF